MEYVGTIGACSFNDTVEPSSGYLLNIPAYLQNTSDAVINEYSANPTNINVNSPSNLAPATLWANPNYLHFVNSSKGAWLLTSEALKGYDNSQGHSLLIFMRFKCASPPTGADTFFFGNAVGSYDSMGLRVRQVGTLYPPGGDGQLVFASYNNGSGLAQGTQTNINICDNIEHSIALFLSRVDNKMYLFVDGKLNISFNVNSQIITNSFSSATHFAIGANGGNSFVNTALTCELRDIKMVYTPNNAKPVSEITQLVNKLHVKPYSTITKAAWGY